MESAYVLLVLGESAADNSRRLRRGGGDSRESGRLPASDVDQSVTATANSEDSMFLR